MDIIEDRFFKCMYWLCNFGIFITIKVIRIVIEKLLSKEFYCFTEKMIIYLLKIKKSDIIFIKSGCGTINVLTKNNFFKIGLRKSIISDEYEKYCLITQSNFKFKEYCLPIRYTRKYIFHILCSDSLGQRSKDIAANDVVYLLDVLRKNGGARVNPIKYHKNILYGLELIRFHFGKTVYQKYRNKADEILNRQYFYGPCHGDFHQENIYKDKNNKIWFIDLDCYRHEGIQALDAIYFFMEMGARKEKRHWIKYIIDVISHGKQKNEELKKFIDIEFKDGLFIYLLDRLGQDKKYIFGYYERRKYLLDSVNLFFLEQYLGESK